MLSAVYVSSCVASVPILLGQSPALWTIAFAFLTANATYLLDRVKLRDRDLDPADALAHPARAAFIRTHSRGLRIFVAVSSLTAVLVAVPFAPLAAALVPCSLAGVVFYARSRDRYSWRPKDLLPLKNPFVAGAIVSFALALHLLAFGIPDGGAVANLALACVFLGFHVTADAALCDLDDREADERYRTRTLPVAIGNGRTSLFAGVMKLLAGIPLLALIAREDASAITATVWALGPLVLVSIILLVFRRSVRDPVDLSMTPVVLAAWLSMLTR